MKYDFRLVEPSTCKEQMLDRELAQSVSCSDPCASQGKRGMRESGCYHDQESETCTSCMTRSPFPVQDHFSPEGGEGKQHRGAKEAKTTSSSRRPQSRQGQKGWNDKVRHVISDTLLHG